MGSCYSDNEYDEEKQEFVKNDPKPHIMVGMMKHQLSKNFNEFHKNRFSWQEYSYVFVVIDG